MTVYSYQMTSTRLAVREDETGRFLVVERGDFRFDLARLSLMPQVENLARGLKMQERAAGMFDLLVGRGFSPQGTIEL